MCAGENGFVTNKTGYIGMDKLFEIGFEAPGRTVYWSDYSGVSLTAPKPLSRAILSRTPTVAGDPSCVPRVVRYLIVQK